MKLYMDIHRPFNDSLSKSYLLVIAIIVLSVIYMASKQSFSSVEEIRSLFGRVEPGVMLYLIAFLVMLLCALTPLPAEIVALGNTLVFSPFEAFFITWISAVISAVIGYECGRLSQYDPCKVNKEGRVCQLISRYGYGGLAIMRLIPAVPFFALNICGGIFKLNRFIYLTITAITVVPAVALLTFFPHLFM